VEDKENNYPLPEKPEFNYKRGDLSARGNKAIEFDPNLKRPSMISMDDYENEEHESNRVIFNLKEKRKIGEWLQMLQVTLPLGFDLDKDELVEFKDG